MKMKNKFLFLHIGGVYLITQISSDIFLSVFPHYPLIDIVCWVITIIGTMLYCMYRMGKNNTIRILSWKTNNGVFTKIIKILLYCQLFSISLFLCYGFVPLFQNSDIVSAFCMVLHFPEVILLQQMSNIIGFVIDDIFTFISYDYIMRYAISIYSFNAVIIFIEFYICRNCLVDHPIKDQFSYINGSYQS